MRLWPVSVMLASVVGFTACGGDASAGQADTRSDNTR